MSGADANLRAALRQAQQALAMGDGARVERCCVDLLKSNPDCADAWYLRALAHAAAGRLDAADGLFRQALSLKDHGPYWQDYARLLALRDNRPAALSALRRAFAAAPGNPGIIYDLALALRGEGQGGEAMTLLTGLLAMQPAHADACELLGTLHLDAGDEAAAATAFRQAVGARPERASAHYNLGVLAMRQGRAEEAEQALRAAIGLDPNLSEAHNNLGMLLHERGAAAAALQAFAKAVALSQDNVAALNNLADMYSEADDAPRAEALYRRILDLDARNPHALAALAFTLARQYRWADLQDIETRLCGELSERPAARVPPFELLRVADVAPAVLRESARAYAEEKFRACIVAPAMVSGWRQASGRRARIGYLSGDVHEHATMHLLAGVLEAHDRDAFEILLYSYGPASTGSARQRARHAVEAFVDCAGMADHAIAERIAGDGIDLLVDLKGYTRHSRLAIGAFRPAPIIVSWLGYPGTLGHPRLADYLIGDPVATPLAHAGHFSETLALMPHCYQPNDRARAIGATPSRAEAGLPETGVVFCSFNQAYKLGPEMFDTWCALLREVPGSVLWLLDAGPEARANLLGEAAARGVAAERLIFAAKLPLAAHLGRLRLADLALDTYPYTSHTTGSDALWAGVPLVTRLGESFAGRVGASLLHAVGLPELVAETQADYHRLARALAEDRARLAGLRERLSANRLTRPLFDTQRFTRDLERLYTAMLRDARQGARAPIVLRHVDQSIE